MPLEKVGKITFASLTIVTKMFFSQLLTSCLFNIIYRVSQKRYPGLTYNNFQTSETITLQSIALDREKSNLDFDMLQLYLRFRHVHKSASDFKHYLHEFSSKILQ